MVMMKDTCSGGAGKEKRYIQERRLGFLSQKGTTGSTGENSVVIRIQTDFDMFLNTFPNVSFFQEYQESQYL